MNALEQAQRLHSEAEAWFTAFYAEPDPNQRTFVGQREADECMMRAQVAARVATAEALTRIADHFTKSANEGIQ